MTTWIKKRKRQPRSPGIRFFFYILLALLITVLPTACKSVEQSTGSNNEVVVLEKETLVPFAVPGDSLTLRALLECDSLNNVLIRSFSEDKSKNMSSSFSLENGIFSLQAKTHPDTVYLKQLEKSKQLTKTITIRTEKTKYVRDLFYWSGIAAWISLIGFLAIKLSKFFRR